MPSWSTCGSGAAARWRCATRPWIGWRRRRAGAGRRGAGSPRGSRRVDAHSLSASHGCEWSVAMFIMEATPLSVSFGSPGSARSPLTPLPVSPDSHLAFVCSPHAELPQTDRVQPRRRLRRASLVPQQLHQALGGLTLSRAAARVLVAPDTAGRRGRVRARTARGARRDPRLLHPDRRRPLRLGPDRRHQRAVATSTPWAAAVPRAQHRALAATTSLELLGRVLAGRGDVARGRLRRRRGGHSINDPEPKYGMVVLGLVAPRPDVTERRRPRGDALVLTKPLGAGHDHDRDEARPRADDSPGRRRSRR